MDLDRLSEFLVIAEEGSFKRAAARLGVAPNVLSTRFRGFEQSLGAELFERDAHHFVLTESGQSLLKHAKGLLDSYDKIRVSMQSIQGASFRSLRLMLCAQMMAAELGSFLDRYCRAYPTLFLGLYDENTCRIREGLQSGEIDVVFAIGRENDFTDLSGRVVLTDYPKMKVHVPNDHHLAKTHSVSFSELTGETFILYPRMRESFTRDLQLSMRKRPTPSNKAPSVSSWEKCEYSVLNLFDLFRRNIILMDAPRADHRDAVPDAKRFRNMAADLLILVPRYVQHRGRAARAAVACQRRAWDRQHRRDILADGIEVEVERGKGKLSFEMLFLHHSAAKIGRDNFRHVLIKGDCGSLAIPILDLKQ